MSVRILHRVDCDKCLKTSLDEYVSLTIQVGGSIRNEATMHLCVECAQAVLKERLESERAERAVTLNELLEKIFYAKFGRPERAW